MNEEHLGQLQQVLSDLEEGLRMRQQDKARIVELENCIKGLIFSDIIRNDGAFITMRGIAINNLDRACKAIGATIDLDALCTAQPSACVIGGTGISSSMRGALAEAGQQPASGGAYSSDPLACSGCAAGCFRCRSSACWAEFKVMTRACLDAEKERDALAAECQRLRSALKEAFEEGFSEGNRQSDDRYHWKGYQRELAESWETSDAKKIAALAGSKEIE